MSLLVRLLFLTALFSAMGPFSCRAAVIERDWLAPGDGLLTFDTVNQREWLDIPATLLSLFGSTTEEAIPAALAELEPGGSLDEFTLASREDVVALVDSAGVDLTDFDSRVQTGPQMFELMNLVGWTLGSADQFPESGGIRSLAIINELNPDFQPDNAESGFYIFASYQVVSVSDNLRAGLFFSGGDDLYATQFVGLSLYRQAVPEPSSLLLYAMGVSWVPTVRRRNYTRAFGK